MKPESLPLFREGVEYRQLHPTKEGNRRWRYTTLKGIRIPIKGITDKVILYCDAKGRVWAKHDQFGLYIYEGYSWNGCSPKYWSYVFGWVGTPDFKSTILASLCHDIGYQFGCTADFPMTKKEVDALFYDMIVMSGGKKIAGIYHGAVDKYGSWDGRPKNGEYSTVL